MTELNEWQLIAIGFVLYPVSKFVFLALMDKACSDIEKIAHPGFYDGADKTDDIEECGNKGCGFNVDGECTAKGTECFGYIDPD